MFIPKQVVYLSSSIVQYERLFLGILLLHLLPVATPTPNHAMHLTADRCTEKVEG